MSNISRAVLRIAIALAVFGATPVVAVTVDKPNNRFAEGVSDMTAPLVALGLAATYFGSGEHAQADAARAADAAIIALGTAELLKPNLKVNDDEYLHSFPSGHAALAFATATSLAEIKPKHKWFYYAGAALIGWSRVETKAHTWADVAAGAALGFGAGKWSMNSENGLLLGRVYRF